MNKLKILWLMKDLKYRWRYLYLLYYAAGCRPVPKAFAAGIKRSNKKEWDRQEVQPLDLSTYDGSGQVVHPDIIWWKNELWMVCTPYPYSVESYENPCVYHGNTVFGMTPIRSNPLAYQENREKGNHISDPCIFVRDNRLSVLFRDTINIRGKITQKLYICESSDGYEWTDKKLILESDICSFVSPAVVENGKFLYLYYIQLITPTGGTLQRIRLDDKLKRIDEISVLCHGIPEGMTIWHIGILSESKSGKTDDGMGLQGIFTLRDIEDLYKYELYWAHAESVDGEWHIDGQVDIPEYICKNMVNVYKCAIIPKTGDVLLSFLDHDFRWCLYQIPGLRDIRCGDERKELIDSYRVFTRIFRKDMSFERFSYKHESNPDRINLYYIHAMEENKVIGTNCFNGAQVIGRNGRFRIAQSCDTAVVPEARGKGVFVNMIARASSALKEDNIDMMIGFPNNNSYHGFIKLGWNHIGTFNTRILITDLLDICSEKILKRGKKYREVSLVPGKKLRNSGDYRKNIFEICPFRDRDFETINQDGKTKIIRSREYYHWKIDANLDGFRYLTIYGTDDILRAYLIYRVNEKGRILVADWFVDRTDLSKFEIMFLELISSVKHTGNVIVMPMIVEGSLEDRILKKAGFIDGARKPFGYPPARMIINPLSEVAKTKIGCFSDWFVASIDTDIIIS